MSKNELNFESSELNLDYNNDNLKRRENILKNNVNKLIHLKTHRIRYINDIRRVLIIRKENYVFIGDNCFFINAVRTINHFFFYSQIDLLCNTYEEKLLLKQLSKGIKMFNLRIINKKIKSIDLNSYDVIIIDNLIHLELVDYIINSYNNIKSFTPSIFLFRKENDELDIGLKTFDAYIKDVAQRYWDNCLNSNNELCLTKSEQKKANKLLIQMGVQKNEKIIVFPYFSSKINKSLKLNDYFLMVKWLTSFKNVKILIFEVAEISELQIHKEICKTFEEKFKSKTIIIKSDNIRQTMSVLANKNIFSIISPCTGITHIANLIYSNFIKSRIIEYKDKPFMLVYAGLHNSNYNPYNWWKDTLVECLLIKKKPDGKKYLCNMKDLENNKLISENMLTADNISFDLLKKYIEKNFKEDFINYINS
ncbi:MAG: hypothetical protein WCK02_15375 [Bacteroidota bacterium]